MTSFPGSPKLLKGGIVLLNPNSGAVLRVIALQYNADSLSRSFQVQTISSGSDRSEPVRLKGPPIETIKLEAEIDAVDQLELPDQHAEIVQNGLHAQLAALETILYPTSSRLQENENLASAGTLEIIPIEAPMTLFVWSKNRIVPVRLTEFSITEEAFDTSLNPIRAKVNLGMRVLSIDDLGFSSKGGALFMRFLQNKERLSARHQGGGMSTFGLNGIP